MFEFFKKKPVEKKVEKMQVVEPEPVEASWAVTMTEPLEEPEVDEGMIVKEADKSVTGLEVKVFENSEFGRIRTTEIENKVWFAAKDVADALGYANARDALAKHVDDEDKQHLLMSQFATIENHLPKSAFPVDFVTGEIPNRGLTFINESGLYALILSSKLPSAKQFKRWVTAEILPSLRKHGAYMTAQTIDSIIADPSNFMKLVSALNDERMNSQRLTAENQKLLTANTQLEWENDGLSQKVEQDKPKVAFAESFKNAEGSITINELAKLLTDRGYETGEYRLYATLRSEGYLIKEGANKNLPTQRASSMSVPIFTLKVSGYQDNNGVMHRKHTTYVTPAGQIYFFKHFCGENYRVSDPLTAEESTKKIEQMQVSVEYGKQGWLAAKKKIDECATVVRKAVDGKTGEKYWASEAEIKSVIPETKRFNRGMFGVVMREAGIERKAAFVSSPKRTNVTRYAMPAVLFSNANTEQGPKADNVPAQEKKPIITMNDLKAAISEIIADGEKRGEKRQLMTVEAFKWAHEELKDLSSAKVEQAMVNAGLRAEKVDGVRMYKVF